MKTHCLFPALLTAILMPSAGWAQTPKLLEDWKTWTTWDESKNLGKPTPFNDRGQVLPIWFSPIEIMAEAAGGSFSFTLESHTADWAALPGDAQCWPQKVTLDDQPATVVNRDGVPYISCSAGRKALVKGNFLWTEMPQSVRVPPQIGVIHLQLNGRPVELPVWDTSGLLWLQRTGTEPADKDFLSVQVYRLITDGSPQWLHTQVELSVAGKSREETLGHVLPEGWRLSSVNAPLPCAVDDAGLLKTQVRAGKWTLQITAYRTDPAQTISFAKGTKPLAAEELVGLQHEPSFRLIEISGIPAVDVAQTTYPDVWRQYPVHQWATGQSFQLDEKMRGMGVRKPQGISIQRSFWLDEDGQNMTYQDDLKGTGQQTWRLDAAEGHKLGAVKIAGAGQLITKNPINGAEGVEVRDRGLSLQAVGRLQRSAHIAATGWQHDAESLAATLNLPPGWRMLAVFGVDWSQGDWLTSWSLFDVFMLLIVTLAIWRTWGWKTACIGLLGFVAAYHELNAPRITWVLLVAVLTAAKWVPGDTARGLINLMKLAALLLFAMQVVPFTIQQIQQALHPQLEPYRVTWQTDDEFRDDEAQTLALSAPMAAASNAISDTMSGIMTKTGVSMYEKPGQKNNISSNMLYDTKAKIQTGPAVPQWKWREVSFGWRGPVSANEKISLWLIPCSVERLIKITRVALILVLVWLLLGRGKELPTLPRMPAKSASAALFSLALLLGFSASTALAQFPPAEMLQQLRERVLADRPQEPQRAEIPHVRLKLQGHRLDMEIEIHATDLSAVPLPGKLPSWSPVSIESNSPTLRHDNYLWVLATPGVQTIKLSGLIPPGAEWQWSFLLKPRQVEIDAAGWTITGLKPNGVPEDQVFFVEQNRSASAEAAYDQKDFFPVVRIERELELGLIWQVRTRVKRLSPVGKAISLSLPLLPAERVMSAGFNADKGRIEVRFGATDQEVSWNSELAPVPELSLKAETSESWVERWTLTASPVWNVHTEGLAPIYETTQAQLIPVWTPWPGESVQLTISRPEAIQGATTTVHQARQETRLGDRQHSTELTLQVQASLGEDFRIQIPTEAEITTLRVRGQELPVRREGTAVIIPVRPGDQKIDLEWKTPGALTLRAAMDAVTLPVQASNITTNVTLPDSRWLLWAHGPMRGPAVRFWGMMITAILFGFMLTKIKLSPLRGYEWALLLLGFMQLPLIVGGMVVIWFFAIAWRGSSASIITSALAFNLLQIALAVASVIAFFCMLAVVHQGLLGTPEMFVTGNGSTTSTLKWFQDRTFDTALTQPYVISVSIWVYRALMLMWALWLASRVLRWLPWAFQQLSTGALWRPLESKPAPTSTPPPLPRS